MGHGTAVFAAIQEKAPEADLYAVRVFDDRLRTSVRALVAAIDWAAERGVRVVNLSLGMVREDCAETLEGGGGDWGALHERDELMRETRKVELEGQVACAGGEFGSGTPASTRESDEVESDSKPVKRPLVLVSGGGLYE